MNKPYPFVATLPDGTNVNILDRDELVLLIREKCGDEAARHIEEETACNDDSFKLKEAIESTICDLENTCNELYKVIYKNE